MSNDDQAKMIKPPTTLNAKVTVGGPGAVAYAVLAQTRNVIAGPDIVSEPAPTRLTCGVFPNGDFVGIYTEDDSLAGVLTHVTNAGVLIPQRSYYSGVDPAGNGNLFPIAVSDEEMVMIYKPYEDEMQGLLMRRFTRGYLAIEVVAADEVRLVNHASAPVDVTLTVTGTK